MNNQLVYGSGVLWPQQSKSKMWGELFWWSFGRIILALDLERMSSCPHRYSSDVFMACNYLSSTHPPKLPVSKPFEHLLFGMNGLWISGWFLYLDHFWLLLVTCGGWLEKKKRKQEQESSDHHRSYDSSSRSSSRNCWCSVRILILMTWYNTRDII